MMDHIFGVGVEEQERLTQLHKELHAMPRGWLHDKTALIIQEMYTKVTQSKIEALLSAKGHVSLCEEDCNCQRCKRRQGASLTEDHWEDPASEEDEIDSSRRRPINYHIRYMFNLLDGVEFSLEDYFTKEELQEPLREHAKRCQEFEYSFFSEEQVVIEYQEEKMCVRPLATGDTKEVYSRLFQDYLEARDEFSFIKRMNQRMKMVRTMRRGWHHDESCQACKHGSVPQGKFVKGLEELHYRLNDDLARHVALTRMKSDVPLELEWVERERGLNDQGELFTADERWTLFHLSERACVCPSETEGEEEECQIQIQWMPNPYPFFFKYQGGFVESDSQYDHEHNEGECMICFLQEEANTGDLSMVRSMMKDWDPNFKYTKLHKEMKIWEKHNRYEFFHTDVYSVAKIGTLGLMFQLVRSQKRIGYEADIPKVPTFVFQDEVQVIVRAVMGLTSEVSFMGYEQGSGFTLGQSYEGRRTQPIPFEVRVDSLKSKRLTGNDRYYVIKIGKFECETLGKKGFGLFKDFKIKSRERKAAANWSVITAMTTLDMMWGDILYAFNTIRPEDEIDFQDGYHGQTVGMVGDVTSFDQRPRFLRRSLRQECSSSIEVTTAMLERLYPRIQAGMLLGHSWQSPLEVPDGAHEVDAEDVPPLVPLEDMEEQEDADEEENEELYDALDQVEEEMLGPYDEGDFDNWCERCDCSPCRCSWCDECEEVNCEMHWELREW